MKAKTQKSLSKRIKLSSRGTILHKRAAANHLRVNKSPRTTVDQTVSAVDAKRVRRMLPNS